MAWLKAITFSNNGPPLNQDSWSRRNKLPFWQTAQLHVEYSFWTILCFFVSLFGIIKKCFLAPRGNFWNVDTFIIQWALLLRDRLNYATKRKKCGESQITANQPMAMRMTLFHSDFHSFIKSISLPPQLSVTSFLRFNSLCLSISTAFCVISLRFIRLHYNLIFSFYLAFVSRSTLGSNTESLWMRACLGEVDDAVCDNNAYL